MAKRYSLWDKFLFRDIRDRIAILECERQRLEIELVVYEVLEKIQWHKKDASNDILG